MLTSSNSTLAWQAAANASPLSGPPSKPSTFARRSRSISADLDDGAAGMVPCQSRHSEDTASTDTVNSAEG